MLNGAKLRELYYTVVGRAEGPVPQGDLLYLVGETRANQNSVLDRGSKFEGRLGLIGYTETERIGYPGSDVWVPELVTRGVPEPRIDLIYGSYTRVDGVDIIHTGSETRALVRYAQAHGYNEVGLCAPRFHLLRTYMHTVHAVHAEYPELRVYPVLGTPLPWEEAANHSQGTLHGIRADFMVEETIRIYTYHAQGNLPDPEEVLAYLDRL